MGVDAHGFEGVDLLAVALDAELGGERGTGLADDHQRGEHGGEFADETVGDERAEQGGGAEAFEGVVTLEAEHEAGESADDENDRQAAHALFVDGARESSAQTAGADGGGVAAGGETGEVAQFTHDAQGAASSGGKHGE